VRVHQQTSSSVVRRLAAIGDIHAEHERLEVALCAARDLAVDAVACTGDVVDGRGSVERCCQLLGQYDVLCVRGNHDRWLFTGVLRDCPDATRLEDLSIQSQQFLKNLPPTREIAIPGGLMLLCHGIGGSDLQKITPFDSEYSLRTNRDLTQLKDSRRYRVMINGHSHDRLRLRVEDLVIINAGALCHPTDPGFVLADVTRNVMQWHTIRNARSVLVDEQTMI
jgi:predicted phosphodiesterase